MIFNQTIKDYCEEKPTTFKEEIDFLSWFDKAKTVDASISSGFTDFMYKVMSKDTCNLLGDPSEATCCEIGFGGGRLLLAASFIFKHAYAIDIHREFERVKSRLSSFNRTNFSLIKPDNVNESIEDKSIDFFYSLITFQHFESWETAESYIKLMKIKLKQKGHGVIFFGENFETNEDVRIVKPMTYSDFPMTLYTKRDFVIKHFIDNGFNVLEVGSTSKKPWSTEKSRQFYVKFQST